MFRTSVRIPVISLCLLAGCQSLPGPKTASSTQGMAVAAQPLAAEAARDVLEAGGNAADAAVAAGFTIAVVEQTMNSIGGRSQILVHNPAARANNSNETPGGNPDGNSGGNPGENSDGNFFAYNGMTEIPASYVRPQDPARDGYSVIATPGVVSALARLHEEHGSLPWARLLAPAIEYAANGFTVLPGEAARHLRALENIQDNPGFRQAVLKTGGATDATTGSATNTTTGDAINTTTNITTHDAGETLIQPQLAATLNKIAEQGAAAFYQGEIATKIAADMAANGGYITEADLANYQTLDGRYISIDYRGYQIHTIAAPAGGGLIVKSLNIMEQFNLSSLSDPAWAAVVNQALAIAIESMGYDYEEADLNQVTSKDWARQQVQRITVPQITTTDESYNNNEQATFAEQQLQYLAQENNRGQHHEQTTLTDWTSDSWGADSHHTTHFVTADCNGMAVSITQTVGPLFGSKVISPELGFVYASTMGTYLSAAAQDPGARPRTTIAPTMVTRNGELELVLGAAGGLRILSGIVQTLSRYIDRGMTLEQAVAAPRIHPEVETDTTTGTRTIKPKYIHAETTPRNGWSQANIAAWEAAGFEIEANDSYGAFSRIHALAQPQPGTWQGAADLDWEGTASAPATSACNR